MKTLIAINTLTSLDAPIYRNHAQMYFRLGRETQDDFIQFHPSRFSIDKMRNLAVSAAMENECDYIWFIDDDVIIEDPVQSYNLMKQDIEEGKANIVAGWTIIRGYPYNNMHFHYNDKNQLAFCDCEGLKDFHIVAAVGNSCTMIDCRILKKIPPPYFLTGPSNTEDIYFCLKATEYADAIIAVEPSIVTHHCLGTEYISPRSKDKWKVFMEDIEGKKPVKRDHDVDYLERLKAAI